MCAMHFPHCVASSPSVRPTPRYGRMMAVDHGTGYACDSARMRDGLLGHFVPRSDSHEECDHGMKGLTAENERSLDRSVVSSRLSPVLHRLR